MSVPSLIVLAIGVVCLIAAAAIAVPTLISRHTYRSFVGTATAHHVLRDSHASWLVDRALRAMVQACRVELQRVPGIVMVVLGKDSVAVHVAAPATYAPAPWTASTDGLVWTASLSDLQVAAVGPATPNPYSGLFTLGVTDAGRVFVDLDQAHGLVSIGGDPASRRDVARRWIAEASARPWATGPVMLVGLDRRAQPRATTAPTIDDAIALVQTGAPGLVLVEGEPSPEHAARLARALESADSRCAVVLVGDSATARWRFTAQQNGWMTSDFLPAARSTADAEDDSAPAATETLAPAVPA